MDVAETCPLLLLNCAAVAVILAVNLRYSYVFLLSTMAMVYGVSELGILKPEEQKK